MNVLQKHFLLRDLSNLPGHDTTPLSPPDQQITLHGVSRSGPQPCQMVSYYLSQRNKSSATSLRNILRNNDAFIAINGHLDKNSRHVKDSSPIVARKDEPSAKWAPVRHIAIHILEKIVSSPTPFNTLSNCPLYCINTLTTVASLPCNSHSL